MFVQLSGVLNTLKDLGYHSHFMVIGDRLTTLQSYILFMLPRIVSQMVSFFTFWTLVTVWCLEAVC